MKKYEKLLIIYCNVIYMYIGYMLLTIKMKLLVICCLLLLSYAFAKTEKRCEPISLDLCSNLGYNETIFPNMMKHQTQQDAGDQLNQYYSLVWVNCSAHLKYFLCSVYVPMCSDYSRPFPPCRHLCEQAKNGCENLMNRFGFKWPINLDCNQYPIKAEGTLCFGPDEVSSLRFNNRCSSNTKWTCPPRMTIDSNLDLSYTFMDVRNCGAPCDHSELLFWSKDEQDFARIWIGCWSLACFLSALFTILTYIIDMKRFLYPERPIVYLSGCYMIIAIAYIAGFAFGDTISCKKMVASKIVTQGTNDVGCTILFMMVYIFGMASSVWWVILTFTWFLAAGLKWGNEAIEEKSPYFHVIGWTVPSIQTILALITLKIEGDIFSGVCSVGVYDANHLFWALLVPLSFYLVVGSCFLVAGFISMFNIRNVVKSEAGINKVEKLEKLMVRIGVFGVLYTVPAAITVGCYFYEYLNKNLWLRGWIAKMSIKEGLSYPCEFAQEIQNEPSFIVFIVKYFMLFIVGITCGFWIWSGKTINSWSNFKKNFLCFSHSKRKYHRGRNQPTSVSNNINTETLQQLF